MQNVKTIAGTLPTIKADADAEAIKAATTAQAEADKASAKARKIRAPRKSGKHANPTPTRTRAQAIAADAKLAAIAEANKAEAEAIAKAEAAKAVVTSRGLARDASTVVAGATNFNQYSDRDTAYLAFFGETMRAHNGKATLAQIHASGQPVPGKPGRAVNPRYAGSAKATDAGAINRLIKAGYITASACGNTLTATERATASAAYNGKA